MMSIKEIIGLIKKPKDLEIDADNKELCKWIDKLSAFIVKEHFNMVCKNDRDLKQRQKEIIKSICISKGEEND